MLFPRVRSLCPFALLFIFLCCKNSHSPAPISNDAAQAIADSLAHLEVRRLNALGDSVKLTANYDQAIAFYQQAMQIAGEAGDSTGYYDSKLDLAATYEYLLQPLKAIELGESTVRALLGSGDSARIGRAYATIAGFYARANQFDKSIEAAQHALPILEKHGSLIERSAATNQLAMAFSSQERWAESLPLLDSALHLMHASRVLNQLPGMLLNIGNCHRNLGHWPEARQYLNAAVTGADSLGYQHIRARAIERLSQVAESTGEPVVALNLYRQAMTIRDSVFKAEKVRAIEALEVQYETKEKEKKIELLKAANTAEVARRNLLFAILAFLTLLAGGWLFHWRSQLRRARHDLREFAQLLSAKNTRLAELELELQKLTTPDSDARLSQSSTNLHIPESLVEDIYNRRILTVEDWAKFKSMFERAYPGLLFRLRKTFPDLTNAEERLFLLIKLNFNPQEAAATLGISTDSIKKGRLRLRKRLGLQEEHLDTFVRNF